MADDRDLYTVLGVPPDADPERIKRAWRDLARDLHPDRNPDDPEAARRFQQVAAAWTILSDPDKRIVYDHMGLDAIRDGWTTDLATALREQQDQKRESDERKRRAREERSGRTDGWAGRRGGAQRQQTGGRTGRRRSSGSSSGQGGRSGGSSAGRRSASGRMGSTVSMPAGTEWDPDRVVRAHPASRPEDVRAEVALSLQQVASGGTRRIAIEGKGPCPSCGGTGKRRSGRFCTKCGGRGLAATTRHVDVTIPVSVASGQTIRVRGEGLQRPDGSRGDLYVSIVTRPHPDFTREGLNLQVDVGISRGLADRGGSIEVPTLDGPVDMQVPAGVTTGQKMRLRGQGLPGPDGRPPGDLYVTLRVH